MLRTGGFGVVKLTNFIRAGSGQSESFRVLDGTEVVWGFLTLSTTADFPSGGSMGFL